MARGKKYSEAELEKAYALYADGESVNSIAKKLKIPYSTVKGWISDKMPDEFEEVRKEKTRIRRRAFIEQADRIIDDGLELLARRFERALKHESELDKLLDEIWAMPEISDGQKKLLCTKLRGLQLQDIKAVTVAIGTLYDKKLIAKGESAAGGDNRVIILPEIKEE